MGSLWDRMSASSRSNLRVLAKSTRDLKSSAPIPFFWKSGELRCQFHRRVTSRLFLPLTCGFQQIRRLDHLVFATRNSSPVTRLSDFLKPANALSTSPPKAGMSHLLISGCSSISATPRMSLSVSFCFRVLIISSVIWFFHLVTESVPCDYG